MVVLSVRDAVDLTGQPGLHLTPNTISRIENGSDALASTMERLQTALENAGVIFIDEDDEGPGVRFKKRKIE